MLPSYVAAALGAVLAMSSPPASSFNISFSGKKVPVDVSYENDRPRFEYQEDDAPSFSLTFPSRTEKCGLLTLVTTNYNSDDTLVETTLYGLDTSCRGTIADGSVAEVIFDGHNTTHLRPLSVDELVRLIGLYAVLQREEVVRQAVERARRDILSY